MDVNVFPLPLSAHLIFVAIGFAFFLIQFIRLRYKYQLIVAIDIVLTMLVYINQTKTWISALGLVEFGLLIVAFVAAIWEKHQRKALAAQEGTENDGDTDDTDVTGNEE